METGWKKDLWLKEEDMLEQLASKILKKSIGDNDEKPAKEKMHAMNLMKKVIPY